jgi:hypothetical protein
MTEEQEAHLLGGLTIRNILGIIKIEDAERVDGLAEKLAALISAEDAPTGETIHALVHVLLGMLSTQTEAIADVVADATKKYVREEN